jgi:predicted transposase YbfD/YdcC
MDALSLVAVLAEVPDPRSCHGRFHPLPAVLGLVTLALLMGRKSLVSIARFGRQYGTPLAQALGFRRGKTPSVSTLSRTLRVLDAAAVEAALSRWVRARLDPDVELISLDGKTLRGSRDGDIPGQHLVAAYAPQVQAVLAQIKVDAKTNEHKAALQLLGVLPLKDKVVIGDAIFCQRDLAAQVVAAEGDYVLIAKDNQPGLAADIQAGFGFEQAARSVAAAASPWGDSSGRAAVRTGGDDRGQGTWSRREAHAAHDVTADLAREMVGGKAGF